MNRFVLRSVNNGDVTLIFNVQLFNLRVCCCALNILAKWSPEIAMARRLTLAIATAFIGK